MTARPVCQCVVGGVMIHALNMWDVLGIWLPIASQFHSIMCAVCVGCR